MPKLPAESLVGDNNTRIFADNLSPILHDHPQYRRLGETVDTAEGLAGDKVAILAHMLTILIPPKLIRLSFVDFANATAELQFLLLWQLPDYTKAQIQFLHNGFPMLVATSSDFSSATNEVEITKVNDVDIITIYGKDVSSTQSLDIPVLADTYKLLLTLIDASGNTLCLPPQEWIL